MANAILNFHFDFPHPSLSAWHDVNQIWQKFMSFGTSSIGIGNVKFVCRAAEHFTIYCFYRSREVLWTRQNCTTCNHKVVQMITVRRLIKVVSPPPAIYAMSHEQKSTWRQSLPDQLKKLSNMTVRLSQGEALRLCSNTSDINVIIELSR